MDRRCTRSDLLNLASLAACVIFWGAIATWNHALITAPSPTPAPPALNYTANQTSHHTPYPRGIPPARPAALTLSRKEPTMQFDVTTLALLAGIFVLAFLAETLTEYFARPFLRPETLPGNAHLPRHVVPAWLLRYIAALVGVALAIAYRADLLALFGLVAWSPWIGYVVTGLIIGRGANYLNDVVDRWRMPTN